MEFTRGKLTAAVAVVLAGAAVALAMPSGAFATKDKKSSKAQKAQSAPKSPTCNAIETLGVCYAFKGVKNFEEKLRRGNEMGCKFVKGRFLASDSCPAAKALGRCVIKGGAPEEYHLYYYPGGRFNRASAEKDCKDSKSGLHAQGAGVWKAL